MHQQRCKPNREIYPTAEDSVVAEPVKVAGHIVNKMAVATSEDCGPAGCPQQVDD